MIETERDAAAGQDEPRHSDERAAEPPEGGADPEPTPGEDPGPLGNPAQDEEALRHDQEDEAEG